MRIIPDHHGWTIEETLEPINPHRLFQSNWDASQC